MPNKNTQKKEEIIKKNFFKMAKSNDIIVPLQLQLLGRYFEIGRYFVSQKSN